LVSATKGHILLEPSCVNQNVDVKLDSHETENFDSNFQILVNIFMRTYSGPSSALLEHSGDVAGRQVAAPGGVWCSHGLSSVLCRSQLTWVLVTYVQHSVPGSAVTTASNARSTAVI